MSLCQQITNTHTHTVAICNVNKQFLVLLIHTSIATSSRLAVNNKMVARKLPWFGVLLFFLVNVLFKLVLACRR